MFDKIKKDLMKEEKPRDKAIWGLIWLFQNIIITVGSYFVLTNEKATEIIQKSLPYNTVWILMVILIVATTLPWIVNIRYFRRKYNV